MNYNSNVNFIHLGFQNANIYDSCIIFTDASDADVKYRKNKTKNSVLKCNNVYCTEYVSIYSDKSQEFVFYNNRLCFDVIRCDKCFLLDRNLFKKFGKN